MNTSVLTSHKQGLQLTVEVDQDSGFCFGVVYAIQMAEDILDEEGRLYCLGDIVHNDVEVKRLQAKGLRIISHEELPQVAGEKVLIRAHGEPPKTYQTAVENNITLIDASCPVVLKLQNRIKTASQNKNNILIYGKHGHAEVKGLLGQTGGKATVFESFDELNLNELPDVVTLYSQTTKNTQEFYAVKKKLQAAGIEVQAFDTICRQVSNREPQLKEFASRFDKIIFVAGTKSSNGKVLFNVCQSVNPNSHFISHVDEMNNEWFQPGDSIGVCGATSTPMWLMEQVKDYLERL